MPPDEASEIRNLIHQLGEANADAAHRASEALVARGPSVIPALLEVLETGNRRVRSRVAEVLKNLKDDSAVEPLLKLLTTHPSSDVRVYAALILGHLGDKRAVEPLIERLQHDEVDDVQTFAAGALGLLKDQQAVEPLLQALNNPEAEVRQEAVYSLGNLAGKQVCEPIMKMLKDEHPQVRRVAAFELGRMGEESALPALEWMAEHDTECSQDGSVKDAAAQAIEMIKHMQGREAE
ncbi:MAG TPA: HEAT repeat domain-containing protein [Ktedonobacterales bacterium]|jgi:HEAT repeat protein